MPQIVPLQPIANQTLQCQLGVQACTLNVYQFDYGLFMDVFVGATNVASCIICLTGTLIVREAYLGFSGDFLFLDTQGSSDPVYTGLGSRFLLLYLTSAEIAALGLPEGVE